MDLLLSDSRAADSFVCLTTDTGVATFRALELLEARCTP
jgi:hypothetical protein